MRFKVMGYIIVLLLAYFNFAAASEEHVEDMDYGVRTLSQNQEIITEVIRNGEQELSVSHECFGDPKSVSDFMMNYFIFFSNPTENKFSGFVECGFIDDNICQLYYGERNIEGDKGASSNLQFEIEPNTGSIIQNSFECWGL